MVAASQDHLAEVRAAAAALTAGVAGVATPGPAVVEPTAQETAGEAAGGT